jgi:hypothetical protein
MSHFQRAMKIITKICSLILLVPIILRADEVVTDDMQTKHQEGSSIVADKQDELAADVQQLIIEQTIPKVIELLNEVETIMDEATDQLANYETGGQTIAAQTEIIEKIHAAAKEKKKQQGSGKSGDAMMDMMERMMGQKPEGEKESKGKGEGEQPGEQSGQGQTGLSDAANQSTLGDANGKSEARRIPKASGNKGLVLPEEFRKALDAYNRGAEQNVK